jgi:perosamine synthetase
MIPIFKPAYNTEKILAEMARIFDEGWTGLGQECIRFEQALARRLQSDYSVFLNSATAALHLAVECLQLPRGSRIAVPDITFISTATAALYAGHVPVLLPVDDNIQLDLDALERVIDDVDAVIVVHYSGNCCDMDRLVALCKAHGRPLIEDCAHALGSSYKGRPLGTFGELGCFSFHSVKNLPIADGGLVIGHARYEEPLRSLRWLGIDKPTYERTGRRYNHSYDVTRLGYKCHGNDLMAVVGLANLELLDAHNARRKAIHDRYTAELEWLQFPQVGAHTQSAHHLVSCCIDDRDRFIDYMAEGGVAIGVHYRPISSLSFYARYGTPAVRERSDRLFRRLATLPCYPDLTADQQTCVINLMNQFHQGQPLPVGVPRAIVTAIAVGGWPAVEAFAALGML